ncbi:hypothetical protein OG783_33230 [Streptomyces jietaisiensis]|uniref:hypothetical protein n=1 Tax=Streptomyces griseoaurantiacus TaxID=68213 RepID=UPI00324D98B8
MITLGQCRKTQRALCVDGDGAALPRVDQNQRPLGGPARDGAGRRGGGRIAEQGEHHRLQCLCAGLGVVEAGGRRHRRDLGGHGTDVGPPALL